jgi:hypothetical protein
MLREHKNILLQKDLEHILKQIDLGHQVEDILDILIFSSPSTSINTNNFSYINKSF